MDSTSRSSDLEWDTELDTVGVILDHPLICGTCMIPMQKVSRTLWRCPSCQSTYEGLEV
jgi:ribosomal protein L37AE/L43A